MRVQKYSGWIVLLISILLFLVNFFVFKAGFLSNLVFWIALPIAVSYILGFKRQDIGISLPKKKDALIIVLLIILATLISLYAVTISEVKSYYSAYSLDLTMFLIWTVSLVSTEFFFRGFMLFGTQKNLGKWSALVQTIPYTLVHLGKPEIEIYFSFFAGLAFALVNQKNKSFLPSYLIHLAGFEIIILAHLM